jgi:hypothetical protein
VTTIAEVLARADEALDALALLGEEVADEWQYVTDLRTVYRGRLAQVAQARGGDLAPPEVALAVDVAVEESALVGDPHRAIDWLSTLPQVVLLALGETA